MTERARRLSMEGETMETKGVRGPMPGVPKTLEREVWELFSGNDPVVARLCAELALEGDASDDLLLARLRDHVAKIRRSKLYVVRGGASKKWQK